MEVFAYMDEKLITKEELWSERIQNFETSGLSRKKWCQQHHTALSTLSYWIRKTNKKPDKYEQTTEPVFARMPSEQEICSKSADSPVPVTIYLPGSVRIEVDNSCSAEMISSLIHIIKNYA